MAYFGKSSTKKLIECHPDLQLLFHEVIKHRNCAIITGRREEQEQNQAFREGRSKLKYPHSTHNKKPSRGTDVIPWFPKPPHIRWNDREAFYCFGGFVLGIAAKMRIPIRWGGDWDRDGELHDQTFFDLPHFELI